MLYFYLVNSSYSIDDTRPKGSQMHWATLKHTTECRISCIDSFSLEASSNFALVGTMPI